MSITPEAAVSHRSSARNRCRSTLASATLSPQLRFGRDLTRRPLYRCDTDARPPHAPAVLTGGSASNTPSTRDRMPMPTNQTASARDRACPVPVRKGSRWSSDSIATTAQETSQRGIKARRPLRYAATMLPAPVVPMMATAVAELPRGDGWSYEVKWDG
jgi:bifunctional non-homologous end joining protein LigD